jgi:hypothetical protein
MNSGRVRKRRRERITAVTIMGFPAGGRNRSYR